MMISIVIPVYNTEQELFQLHKRILEELCNKYIFEIVFIYDEGSKKSWEVIKYIAEIDPEHVRAFQLDSNYGQQNATLYGLKMARGTYIITMDDDYQHNPKYIPEMVEKMENENFDIIYGKYRKNKQLYFKFFLSRILNCLLCFFIPKLPRNYSSYRLIKKELVNSIQGKYSSFLQIDVELGSLSPKIGSIIIEHFPSLRNESSYSFKILFYKVVDVLFGYSIRFNVLFNFLLLLGLISFIGFIIIHFVNFKGQLFSVILIISIMFCMILIKIGSMRRIRQKLIPSTKNKIN